MTTSRLVLAVLWSRTTFILLLAFAWLGVNLASVQAQSGGFGGGFAGGGGFGGVPRFPFKIDDKTPLKQLLPTPPIQAQPHPSWMLTDLKQVPEIYFQKPLESKAPSAKQVEQATDPKDKEKLSKQIADAVLEGTKQTAHTLAKINHLNEKEADRCIRLLQETRPDLAGLPFMMGDACRMNPNVSRQFVREVGWLGPINGFAGGFQGGGFQGSGNFQGGTGGFTGGGGFTGHGIPAPLPGVSADEMIKARISALMQIIAAEKAARRKKLVEVLAGIQHRESTRALGKLAVFSMEKEVRDAAVAALKYRPRKDYTDSLLQGLRYPWPAIAKNATEATIQLQRTDLIPQLVEFLDEPDPRAPVVKEVNGKETPMVREVVRLNHHHNCITCHAPANSDPQFNKTGSTTDFAIGAVSIPGQEISGANLYYSGNSPDIFVRADVSYLRQDFSLMQAVANPEPWPALQRYDFLVRTRALSGQQAASYEKWVQQQGPRYVSPYHHATQDALRRLTGRDAQPNAAAWRAALAASS